MNYLVSASKNVFEENREWFVQFENEFKGFIDYFRLHDFVDDNYDVYNLASYKDGILTEIITEHPDINCNCNDNYPEALQEAYIPSDYSNYIRGCTYAIQNRTKRMNK